MTNNDLENRASVLDFQEEMGVWDVLADEVDDVKLPSSSDSLQIEGCRISLEYFKGQYTISITQKGRGQSFREIGEKITEDEAEASRYFNSAVQYAKYLIHKSSMVKEEDLEYYD